MNTVALLLAACNSVHEPEALPVPASADPFIPDRMLLAQLLRARHLSAEFDQPTRLLLERVCRVARPKDARLAMFMRAWPLDAIFPYMPLLNISEAGCGTYQVASGRRIVLPVRAQFEAQQGPAK